MTPRVAYDESCNALCATSSPDVYFKLYKRFLDATESFRKSLVVQASDLPSKDVLLAFEVFDPADDSEGPVVTFCFVPISSASFGGTVCDPWS